MLLKPLGHLSGMQGNLIRLAESATSRSSLQVCSYKLLAYHYESTGGSLCCCYAVCYTDQSGSGVVQSVALQTLDLAILVRVQAPEPSPSNGAAKLDH